MTGPVFRDTVVAAAFAVALSAGTFGLLFVARRLMRLLPARRPFQLPTEPIPEAWPAIVERQVPLTRALSGDDRTRLLRITRLFLRDVPMEGVGLELDDEMRLTIAATACLLLLHLPYPKFAALRRVLVYPDTFVPVQLQSRHSAVQTQAVPTLGQAWRDGIVVLSWTSVLAGNAQAGDEHNVVLHEFAHVLDGEDGVFDGTPILDSPDAVREWGRIFAAEFDRQQDAVNHAQDVALDPYGTTNRAEFFAVATEAFFEAGERFRERLPDLYEQLRRFYRP